jgi:putative FmdB family regulatory protein
MPLYEYECDDCHQAFDELRKVDEREKPIQCPRCGGEGRVVISGFAQGGGSSRSRGSCNPGST